MYIRTIALFLAFTTEFLPKKKEVVKCLRELCLSRAG